MAETFTNPLAVVDGKAVIAKFSCSHQLEINPMRQRPRSDRANGEAIRRFRVNLGWTQLDLANKSGYSPRLIRKAEGGGHLDLETLQNLAESLSCDGQQVGLNDITVDIRAVAVEWMNTLNESTSDLGTRVCQHLTNDVVLHCPGLPETAPFIGNWHGVDGVNQFWHIYTQFFRRIPHQDVTYAVSDDLVIARFFETGYFGDQFCGPVRVHMVLHFRDSKIYRIDDDYDTQAAALTLKRAEDYIEARNEKALKFVRCYERFQVEAFESFSTTLADTFVIHCPSNCTLPFVGTFSGWEGLKEFFQAFYTYFTRLGDLNLYTSLVVDDRIVISFEDSLRVGGQHQQVEINLHIQFSELLISRVEFQIDLWQLQEQLAQTHED